MRDFIHLHLHSAYSLAEGAIPVDRLAKLCEVSEMPAVAVTDTNNLFGALDVSETLSGRGIQPIIGIQLDFSHPCLVDDLKNDRGGLVLLAQNELGYENLMALASDAYLNAPVEIGPCADFSWLNKRSEGLLCLTGGFDGLISALIDAVKVDEARAALEDLARVFGDRLYVELQRHADRSVVHYEDVLLNFAYENRAGVVATNEPFFPTRADYDAHDALICIAQGAYVYQDERRRLTSDHYFKNADEMAALFSDIPEAISSTIEIAHRCAFRPQTRDPILPRFTALNSANADENETDTEELELKRQAEDGLAARLKEIELAAPEEAYWERLKVELSIINKMGFPGYFLIVADFIKWAKKEGIPVGPGRGSGAGSLVAYALTVTDLDPLRFGLLFERFLNPERVSMPDFDVDFCQERRDEVIEYVQGKYGRDRVAQIITFGKLQARAVLRDVGRVLGMPFGQVDRLCKLVPNNPANPVTLQQAVELEPKLQEERSKDSSVELLITTALKLEGLYRHASTHAAGVVIGDRPLEQLAPLYIDPRSDMPATQFNMRWVELAGLVKFDFLGLKTLTVIDRAVALAASMSVSIDVHALPLNDEKTFGLLGEGDAVGVFQLESPGMRATLKSMKPDSLDDVIALISLYRPGPMENIPTFIERKQGIQKPDYLHPSLETILKETYGVIIYQEQVMQIAQVLSGYSLGEADLLRRAMGKKKKEEMDRQRQRFVDGASERNVPIAKAGSIFDLVQKFAGYGFNKSHAAAYAFIAYQTAFLKANHPEAFLAASMSLDMANTDKLAVFARDAKLRGVDVVAPTINRSVVDFSIAEGEIIYALGAIKNVGAGALNAVVVERNESGPFEDIFDLAERVDLRQLGKRSLENMVRAGVFDEFGIERAVLLQSVEMLMKHSALAASDQSSAQAGLFDDGASTSLERPKLATCEAWPWAQMLSEERAAFGFYMSGHPLDEYNEALEALGVASMTELSSEAEASEDRRSGLVAVVVRKVRMRRSKSGKPFAWVECSDRTSDFEATIFSEALSSIRDLLVEDERLLLTLSAEKRDGDVRFTIEGGRGLDEAAAKKHATVVVTLEGREALAGVRRRVAAADGDPVGRLHVRLPVQQGGREVVLDTGLNVAPNPAVKSVLKSVPGVVDVTIN